MTPGHISRVRQLYKLILRLHRTLPDDLRILGNNYAKEEFKKHRSCKPDEANTFLKEWSEYARSMAHQANPLPERRAIALDPRIAEAEDFARRLGQNLPPDRVLQMTPNQLFNLYLLMASARGDDSYEPLDAGIELLDADDYAWKVEEAKKFIFKAHDNETLQIIRGEISEKDRTIATGWWVHVLDEAVELKDSNEERRAKLEQAMEDARNKQK